jgi:hypothetical protein
MKNKYITLSLILASLLLAGCSSIGKVGEIDPQTGKIKNQSIYGEIKPVIVKSEHIDISKYKSLILVLGDTYFKNQTEKFGYFQKVVNRVDMEQLLVSEGKSDIVSDVTNILSWKKINDNYKPLIVLKPDLREEGRTTYAQIKVIEAGTAKEVFVAEVKLDFMWKGVNDATVYYPLYNAFIEYVNSCK